MGEVIDLGYKPRAWQLATHRTRKRFAVLVAHRRSGKTILAIMTLIDAALRGKPGLTDCRYAYIAPFLAQAKAIAWLYLCRYAQKVPGLQVNQSELWVQFPNGSQIRLYGADRPDALRGIYLDGVVPDEVAQMKPEMWQEVLRPALADREGWALFIGTPNGTNLLSELYNHAVSDPAWVAWRYTVRDTKALPDAEVAMIERETHRNTFAREFLCDFSAQAANQLLSVSDVDTAVRRKVMPGSFEHAPKIIAVDVARQGEDATVILKRQGIMVWEPIVMQGADSMAVADRIMLLANEWQPDGILVDGSGGYGAGVIDRLRRLQYRPIEVQFGASAGDAHYANKRAEMWFNMAEWVRSAGSLPNIQRLIQDLTAPTYEHDAKDRMILESKDDMRSRGLPSPDYGDALAISFAYAVRASGGQRAMPIEQGGLGALAHVFGKSAATEKKTYDPLGGVRGMR